MEDYGDVSCLLHYFCDILQFVEVVLVTIHLSHYVGVDFL